jgi:hypothetical protein
MENEIYRGKRIDNKEWAESSSIMRQKDGTVNLGSWIIVPVIPETVCKPSGIPDKSGEKLFTGDIVRVCNSKEDYSRKLIVTFEDGAFCLRIPGTTDFSDAVTFRDALDQAMQKGQVPIYEKLGNVFDNPDLLK